MKKLLAILLALLLVASFSVTVFATEGESETIPSPTDAPKIEVDFNSCHPGDLTDVHHQYVDKGATMIFQAPESEYDFLGFLVEGEDYEVVSGGEYILESYAPATRNPEIPTLVLIVNGPVKVTAVFDVEEVTEPTTATQPDDDEGDSPQTGDSMLVYCIAGALLFGFVGFAFAGKKLLKKEN